jgi:AraC family transcriptional regulator
MTPVSPFPYRETHRVVHQPANLVHWSSDGAGWKSLFACLCSEAPYEGSFSAVKDHLVVIPLAKPVRFTRRIGGELQEQILPPGSTTITPGGADFSIRTSSQDRRYDTMHLYIRDELVREVYSDMFGPHGTITLQPRVGVIDEMFRAIAYEIRKMLQTPMPADSVYAETLARTAAGYLVRNYISGQPLAGDSARALTPQQCNRAIEYIEERMGENLTLAGIAKAAGISTSRLNSEFKRSMKLAPYQYVLNARVRRANVLLMSTDLSLAQIALQCGFSNQQHMTRMMRRIIGRTPGAIRRER